MTHMFGVVAYCARSSHLKSKTCMYVRPTTGSDLNVYLHSMLLIIYSWSSFVVVAVVVEVLSLSLPWLLPLPLPVLSSPSPFVATYRQFVVRRSSFAAAAVVVVA